MAIVGIRMGDMQTEYLPSSDQVTMKLTLMTIPTGGGGDM